MVAAEQEMHASQRQDMAGPFERLNHIFGLNYRQHIKVTTISITLGCIQMS